MKLYHLLLMVATLWLATFLPCTFAGEPGRSSPLGKEAAKFTEAVSTASLDKISLLTFGSYQAESASDLSGVWGAGIGLGVDVSTNVTLQATAYFSDFDEFGLQRATFTTVVYSPDTYFAEKVRPYISASLGGDFTGPADLVGSAGAGLTYTLNSGLSLFTDAAHEWEVSTGDDAGWTVRAGVQFGF